MRVSHEPRTTYIHSPSFQVFPVRLLIDPTSRSLMEFFFPLTLLPTAIFPLIMYSPPSPLSPYPNPIFIVPAFLPSVILCSRAEGPPTCRFIFLTRDPPQNTEFSRFVRHSRFCLMSFIWCPLRLRFTGAALSPDKLTAPGRSFFSPSQSPTTVEQPSRLPNTHPQFLPNVSP